MSDKNDCLERKIAKEIGDMSDESVEANVEKYFVTNKKSDPMDFKQYQTQTSRTINHSAGQAVAKRAVKAKGWRWLPGMLARGEDSTSGNPAWVRLREFHNSLTLGGQANQLINVYPDLTDPATIGCLLALVRDAHRDAYMAAGCDGEDWIVADCDGFEVSRGRSEREALVKALEAAS